MRFNLGSILVLLSLLIVPGAIKAQETQSAGALADELRVQLIEVQTNEESLRIKALQLEDELKPENIERALAGIGSTKPEELREQRRRQLTIERDSIRARIKVLELSKARLEMAILAAEARAYHESALATPTPYSYTCTSGPGVYEWLVSTGYCLEYDSACGASHTIHGTYVFTSFCSWKSISLIQFNHPLFKSC